jgi:hypothetical protein
MATSIDAAPASATQPVPIDDDMRQVIAEHLLDGADTDLLARTLADASGQPIDVVRGEIDAALDSPYLMAATRFHARLAKWGWVLGNRTQLASDDPDQLIIPVLDKPDAATFYRDHYRAHRPALIRGLVDHWPARASWSLDHVAQRVGDTPVEVQWGRDAGEDFESNSAAYRTARPFGEIADRLRSAEASNDFYVTANNDENNRAAFGPLFDEVSEIPEILAAGGAKNGFLWIGPKGTVTPWHHDLTNNLLLQMVGRKRVRLVASEDTPAMRNHRHCYSLWNSDDLLPGLAQDGKPAVLECTIGPGEALFIPIGWWHHVEGLNQTIGMSFTRFRWNNDFYSRYQSYGNL